MDWKTHMRGILTTLGEDAVFSHAGGQGTTVRVIYLAPYQKVLDLVQSSEPQLACMAEDVPTLAQDDTFTLRGLTYKAQEIKPDIVSGVTVCGLEEQ